MNITEILKEFEKKYHDNGDERYGLSKHNNTILDQQLDFLQEKLEALLGEIQEEIEYQKIKTDENDEDVTWSLKRKHNQGLDIAVAIIESKK